MAFYSQEQLNKLGLKKLGKHVQVSDLASIYGAQYIEIGDHTRIDDFCVLSASPKGICIGRHVHIAVFCSLIGAESIVLDDYSGISARVSIFSSNDDYSGQAMTNPTVPTSFTRVTSRPVHIGKHVIVGAGSIILPGVCMGVGSAVGALSLVSESFGDFAIVKGNPAKIIKMRSDNLLKVEQKWLLELTKTIDSE